MNAEVLESYLIPAQEGILSKFFSKKPSSSAKSGANYESMSNKELANIMWTRLQGNPNLKLCKLTDPGINEQYSFNKMLATQAYGNSGCEDYMFGNVPVLVMQHAKEGWENPTFNVWAIISGYGNRPQMISTPKKDLIASFRREDSQ